MTEKKKKILIIVLAVVSVIIIVFGVIFNISQNKKRDWDGMNQIEEEEAPAEFPFEDGKIAKEGFGALKSVVLRNSSDTMQDRYTFEVSISGDKTYFSCMYYKDGEKVVIENQEINSSRLTQMTDIIDRYTVATTIRNYRKDPESVSIVSDDIEALELTWLDGDFVNLGYPNGAGPALKKYFTELSAWMAEEDK